MAKVILHARFRQVFRRVPPSYAGFRRAPLPGSAGFRRVPMPGSSAGFRRVPLGSAAPPGSAGFRWVPLGSRLSPGQFRRVVPGFRQQGSSCRLALQFIAKIVPGSCQASAKVAAIN